MPNHQNPSGRTLAADRRRILLRAAAANGVPVLADEAYLHLRYDPGEPDLLAAADPQAPVVSVGTFSKTIAPGLRVAWTVGPAPLIERLALLKQVADLHTNSFSQRVVHRYLAAGELPGQIARLREAYRTKRDGFLAALDRHLAGRARFEARGDELVGLAAAAKLVERGIRRDAVEPCGECGAPVEAMDSPRERDEFMRMLRTLVTANNALSRAPSEA